MKSVGEVMGIARTFKESLFKALRSLESTNPLRLENVSAEELQTQARTPKLAEIFLPDLRHHARS